MQKNSKLILFGIPVFLLIMTIILFINRFLTLNSHTSDINVNPNIEDVSKEFIIDPRKEYSLFDKSIVIPPDYNSVPGIPERMSIKVPVLNSFSKPLWVKGKDCNYHGVLEKQTLTGWVVADEEPCSEDQRLLPGRFFNNGVDELDHAIFTKDAKGTYRVRLNMLYGCAASTDAAGKIVYGNCQGEIVSYSPTFKVVN